MAAGECTVTSDDASAFASVGTPPCLPVAGTGATERADDELAARVARLRQEVTALVALDPAVDGATGPQLHAELRTAVGQLQAFAARILARVEADGRWSAGSARTFGEWVARTQLASPGAVRREVALGRALDGSLPGTAAAVAAGEVTLGHAEVLARAAATSPARQQALASPDTERNEAALLEHARRLPLDAYRREVDRWAMQVDAARAEAEHDAACAKEYLTLARRGDGVALQGFLTFEHADSLAIALRSVAGVPSQGDTRSREERQAAALVDAGRLILDRGFSGSGQQVRPHVIVHVSEQTFRRIEADHDAAGPGRFDGLPPAQLADGTPLPPTSLARLVCDGELTRVVLDADGAVLDVGRARRTYTGQQRLAVIARDRSCRFPGCGAPPTLGEVHHVTSWAHGGPTSVANGILLCWFHHDLVHRRAIRITRVPGGWDLRRSDGTPVDDDHRARWPSATQSHPPAVPRPAADPTTTRVPAPDPGTTRAPAADLATTCAPAPRPASTRESARGPSTTRAPGADPATTRAPGADPGSTRAPSTIGRAPSSWGGPRRASPPTRVPAASPSSGAPVASPSARVPAASASALVPAASGTSFGDSG